MFVRITRAVLGLAMIALGFLSVEASERELRQWQAGDAFLTAKAETTSGIAEVSPRLLSAENDGHIVYLVGPLSLKWPRDPLTDVSVPAIRLRRVVEMYQWREHLRSNTRGSYSYDAGWSERLIDSDQFHNVVLGGQPHDNPHSMPYDGGVTFEADDPAVGAYKLDPAYLQTMTGDWKPVPADLVSDSTLRKGWNTSGGFLFRDGEPIDVGAVRVRYDYLPLEPAGYSIIGIQQADTIVPDGVMGDHDAAIFEPGRRDVQTLLADFRRDVETFGTGGRWSGGVWMALGFMLALRPGLQLLHRAPAFTDAPARRRLVITLGASLAAAGAMIALIVVLAPAANG